VGWIVIRKFEENKNFFKSEDEDMTNYSEKELIIRLEEKVKYLSNMVYSEFKTLSDYLHQQKQEVNRVETDLKEDIKKVNKQHQQDYDYLHGKIENTCQDLDRVKTKIDWAQGAVMLLYLIIAVIGVTSIRL
jgi:uncharacterized protein with von Willebrand factor type A (vWA) domain